MSRPRKPAVQKPETSAAPAPSTPVATAAETPIPAAPPQPETTGAESAPAPVSAASAAEAAPAPVDPNMPTGPGASAEPANDPNGNPPSSETPKPMTGPDGVGVKVQGPAKGRWRIGRHFGPEPVVIPLNTLTEPQLSALLADPELTCGGVDLVD